MLIPGRAREASGQLDTLRVPRLCYRSLVAHGSWYGGLRRSYEFLDYMATDFRKYAITIGSFGPMVMALPPCPLTQFSVGSQGLFPLKSTVCLSSSGQTFTQDLSGSLHGQSRSVLGESCDASPVVVPTRAWLDEVRRFMRGDYSISRGSTQRGLTQSLYCNDYKVSVYGRKEAIWRFEQKLRKDQALLETLWTMSGLRLVCHCKRTQECHGDAIIQEFRQQYPDPYDRAASTSARPSPRVLKYLARLREEPESEDDTSPDEGAPSKGSGWRGKGPPLMVGKRIL